MGSITVPLRSGVNLCVLGAQWGDEGKGKIVDLLSPHFDLVARYQGGHNAGHTVYAAGQKYVLHLIPSGILHPEVVCVIGNGLVVDIAALFKELDMLQSNGVDTTGRLFISDRAHLILPYHLDRERFLENQRGEAKIGTTGRGIGLAYEDKIVRCGIRVGDLWNMSSRVESAIKANVEASNRLIDNSERRSESVVQELKEAWPRLKPFVTDTSLMLQQRMKEGASVMFEGAQGTLLDIDHGTYPYVTSSNATVGGVLTGLGVGPQAIGTVLGITKAYTTRVGNGAFPTELDDSVGARLRELGEEFGASTGRPRRCGWFDGVALRYAARINGLRALAITKLDVLDHEPQLKICTAYRCDGREIREMPSDPDVLARCEPVYETMPGWLTDTSAIRDFSYLPSRAKDYIKALHRVSGVVPKVITNGQDRGAFIVRNDVCVPGMDWIYGALKHD